MSKAVNFKANYDTFQCIMIIASGYKVNFCNNRFMETVLGFETKSYEAEVRKGLHRNIRFKSRLSIQY